MSVSRRHLVGSRSGLSLAGCLTLSLAVGSGSAQMKRSCQEIETFMLTAKMRVLRAPAAVADDGTTQHRVFFHTSDDTYRDSANRDTWKANVAAYELTKILEVYIMPPYVETTVEGKAGSVSWGLDDVMMDEVQRNERNLQPPDVEAWNKQYPRSRTYG